MATITINGTRLQVGDQERLNAIEAARRLGVEIPHYCWHPALSVVASCRMCLVEFGDTQPDGEVAMQPKLVPACQAVVRDGSVVITNSQRVKDAQAATLEYLLLNHPLDCPTCDQAGECWLQDYSFRYGRSRSRLQEPKLLRQDKNYIGDHVILFTDRCIMCSRCVRFTREVSGTGELEVINRGSHAEIDIFPGRPCNNKLAGNVVDLCPVGALCSKDFLYQQRVWWLRSEKSVCPNCSTGCSIHVDQNQNTIYRLRPRFNPQAQGHFMCDEGRFGFRYVQAEERLREPIDRTRRGAGGLVGPARDGQKPGAAPWEGVLASVRQQLGRWATEQPAQMVVVFSPWMTCEEAYLLAILSKELSAAVRLALGPVPIEGADDTYPKDSRGNPVEPVKFTIHAEKCPNRLGVEAILRHFQGEIIGFEAVWREVRARDIRALYLMGGDRTAWLTREHARGFEGLELLVVQDILDSPAASAATFVLPGASFAEKDGTFVNHAGLAQAFRAAIRPPGQARSDGRILSELLRRPGLFHAPSVRSELARQVPFFAPLATAELGEYGTFLGRRP